MSFILDALRKSEHARQHLGGATLAELPLGRRPRSQPWWVVMLAVLLLGNLVVLTVVLLRKPEAPSTAAAAPQTTPIQQPLQPRSPVAAPTPLAEEAAPAPDIRYETIPRDQAPLDFPTEVPPVDGPTLVRQAGSEAPSRSEPVKNESGATDYHVDMHVYDVDPKGRFVFINMKKYTEGQSLPEGPRITEITPDGVILYHQGQQLRLPRS